MALAQAVEATPDGGYILAGYTRSFGAGAADAWLLKLDANGNLVWQKTYGGSSDDYAYSVQPTSDGGYIVAGSSISLGGGLAEYAWLFKVDASGNVVWQKRYGNGAFDRAAFVRQTSDGGYIVAADTQSFQPGATDVWVLRLDAVGDIVWQKKYGGANDEFARTVQPTSDGGYIVAGYTISFGAGGPDAWLLKLDAGGNVTWQKTYGGAGSDIAQSAHPTADGGYIVAGSTTSFGAGGNDLWVLKVDASGNIVWQRTYGGAGEDGATAVQPTSDGGYIVAGATQSFGTLDELNAWLLKLDSTGTVIWQRTFAGAGAVAAHAVQPTSDGGYVMAGRLGGVVDAVHAWVAKVDADGLIHGCSGIGTSTASAADGGATAANSTAVGTATHAPSAFVSIIPKMSTAVPLQQCSSATAAIPVPTVSSRMLTLLAGLVAAGAAFVLRRYESI